MAGFSIFMNRTLSKRDRDYLKQMSDHGFEGVFTSMHIPEDDASQYHQRLTELANATKALNLKLMVDISRDALQKAGFSLQNLNELLEIGVTGLRMDYGISMTTIAAISREMTVSLNASTLTYEDIDELQTANADFDHLEAWHNYYPRPETGLDEDHFEKQNLQLKKWGFKIVAFVASDDNLRGPLYQGLPTLESHRNRHPLAAELELYELGVDEVYIGDGGLSEVAQTQYEAYWQQHTILLHAKSFDESKKAQQLIFQKHHQRQDAARDVVRSEEARIQCDFGVTAKEAHPRVRGVVTLDNEKYGRYMGELQLVKHDLPADDKVNVVAEIDRGDQDLLDWIKPGQQFQIQKTNKF